MDVREAEGETEPRAVLEYVVTPGCRDCRAFRDILATVAPDFGSVTAIEVAAHSDRGLALTLGRGASRFPVIVLDDQILAMERITEDQLRAALARAVRRV